MKKKVLAICLALCLALSFTAFIGCEKEKPVEVVEKYTITVTNGTGAGSFEKGADVTVKANAPKEDYSFDGWKSGDKFVSSDEVYTFKAEANVSLEAIYSTAYSVWDGKYPTTAPSTFVVEDTEYVEAGVSYPGRVLIQDAAALAYFNTQCTSNGKDGTFNKAFQGKLIVIESNIDLEGKEWKSIDAELPILDRVTLDGKNNTIKGMFNVSQPAEASETAKRGWGSGGFISMLSGNGQTTIKNLTFKNAEVVGTTGQMGVVIGGFYRANVTLDNVNVLNSTVNGGTGKRVGGLIGRIGNNGDGSGDHEALTINNCSVLGSTIVGSSDVGGLVGAIYTSRWQFHYDFLKNHVPTSDVNLWDSARRENCIFMTELAFNRAEFYKNQKITYQVKVDNSKNELVVAKAELAAATTDDAKAAAQKKIDKINNDITASQGKINEAIMLIPAFTNVYNTWNGYIEMTAPYGMKIVNSGNKVDGNVIMSTNPVNGNATSGYNYLTGYNCLQYSNVYNEACNEPVSAGGYNSVIDLQVLNTIESYTDADGKIITVKTFVPSADTQFIPMFNAYAEKVGNASVDVRAFANRPIYITTDIDMTALFAKNSGASATFDWSKVVLPSTITIYKVGGAQLTGIPASVLANVKIVEVK